MFDYNCRVWVGRREGEGRSLAVIELQGIDNVRDLGGIPLAGGREVVSGLLFRGGALFSATDADRDVLFRNLGIRCVIDVRCGWEREAKPDGDELGVENLHIPFYDLEKVGIEYTEPADGTKVVGRDVACEPVRFYRSLANPLTVRQMGKGLNEALSRSLDGQAIYLHCSGGKDRAGIMALLVLTVLGASREAILEDYLYTNVARDKNYAKMFERFKRLAEGDEERAHELVVAHRAVPENLEAFYGAIDERYGGMDDFMRNQLGVTDSLREEARAKLAIPSPSASSSGRIAP